MRFLDLFLLRKQFLPMLVQIQIEISKIGRFSLGALSSIIEKEMCGQNKWREFLDTTPYFNGLSLQMKSETFNFTGEYGIYISGHVSPTPRRDTGELSQRPPRCEYPGTKN